MAACKCKICKKSLNTNDAYCVVANGKKYYYCSAIEYESNKKEKEEAEQLKDKFYTLFCEILGVNGITNTALWKEKAEINKVFSDNVIVACLEENKDYLTNAVGRLNGGIYGKIRYVSVVLRNKLGDFKPKVKDNQKDSSLLQQTSDFTLFNNVNKNKHERKSFAELEDAL